MAARATRSPPSSSGPMRNTTRNVAGSIRARPDDARNQGRAAPERLVAPRPAEREALERREAAVAPDHVVIGDRDGGGAAGPGAGIEGEGRKAVGMRGIAHGGPGCV